MLIFKSIPKVSNSRSLVRCSVMGLSCQVAARSSLNARWSPCWSKKGSTSILWSPALGQTIRFLFACRIPARWSQGDFYGTCQIAWRNFGVIARLGAVARGWLRLKRKSTSAVSTCGSLIVLKTWKGSSMQKIRRRENRFFGIVSLSTVLLQPETTITSPTTLASNSHRCLINSSQSDLSFTTSLFTCCKLHHYPRNSAWAWRQCCSLHRPSTRN